MKALELDGGLLTEEEREEVKEAEAEYGRAEEQPGAKGLQSSIIDVDV